MKTSFTRMKTLLAALVLGAASMNAWGQSWVATDIADLTAEDVVVIVDVTSASAMNNDNETSAPDAVSVTLSADGTQLDMAEVPDNLKWNIAGADGVYTIYPNGVTDTWLYCTSANNGVKVGKNTANTFEWDASTNKLKHVGTNRWLGVYNTQDWRCYTSATQSNIVNTVTKFFKYTSEAVISAPAFSLEGGSYLGAQSVELTHESGAEIYYTTDGSDPMTGGTLYSDPIEVPSSMTIKAVAKSGDAYSAVVSETYTIKNLTADLPYRIDFNEASGLGDWLMTTNNNSVQWSIAGDYAEINGYRQNSEVWFVSPQVSSPTTSYVLNFESGAYFSGTPLELYYATDYDVESGEATWQEITDAAAWATSDTWVASGDVKVTSEQPIRFAFKYTSTSSNAMRWRLRNLSIVEGEAPSSVMAPKISLESGTYFGTQNVTLTHAEGLEIYYTRDGSDPRESGMLYENAIEVSSSMTLKAAAKSGDEYSDVVTAEYTIKQLTAELPYSIAFNETTGLGDWIVTSNNVLVTWTIDEYNGTEYANINAYGKGASEVWLISPEVSSKTGSYALNFLNAINFSGGSFELYYAADYDVEKGASEATWSNITDQAAWSTGGYAWTESGEVLVMSDQPIRFAFKYVSEADAAMGCEIRDLSIAPGPKGPMALPYEVTNDWDEKWGDWTTTSTGDRTWAYDDFFNNYVKVGHSGSGAAEAWLISPAVTSATTSYVLSFQSKEETEGIDLQLYWANDYDAEAGTATWTEITDLAKWSDSSNDWTESGNVEVVSESPVRFAFKYTATAESASKWDINDLSIVEGEAPAPAEEALPLNPPYEISFTENLDGWTTKLTDSAYSPDTYKWTSSADGATLDGYGWNGEAWLISPLVESSNGIYAFSFESLRATQYGGTTMHLYYTAGYDVNEDPVISEWTEVTDVVWSSNDWTPSGELTVESDQPIRFAFVMDNMSGDEWFLRNVTIKEGAEPIEVAAPAFSVEAGQVPQGTVVELSCETEGATIYYYINDGEDTEYTEPIVLNEVGYMDITAWAELDGVESSTTMMSYEVYAVETIQKVITVQPKGTDTWMAMSTTFDGEKFDAVSVTVGADGKVEQAEGLLWTLVYNDDETQVAIKAADGQYVAYGTSGTNLLMQEEAYMWNVTDNGDGSCMLEATTGSNRALAFRGGTQNVFRGYSLQNTSNDEYQFNIYLRDPSEGTGIDHLSAEGMRVYSNGGTLFITVDEAQDVQVYSIDGRMLRNLQLEEGMNAVNGLAQGIYIVNNQKVVVK